MKYIYLLVALLYCSHAYSQQPLELQLEKRGEIVVSIQQEHLSAIENIKSFSIDRIENGKAILYLNKKNYQYLIKHNIPFVPEVAPSLLYKAKMVSAKSKMVNWDAYPTYNAYLNMMQQFAIDFPKYCKLDTIGYTEEDRLLLALKISDNVQVNETEPEFFYTSSMHGDELVGYVLMLRLADYLLNNMADEQVARLVNNIEIYINPLANPDGAYLTDNTTVQGAIRLNANGVDLNRNFPDPKLGYHPDGNIYQAETMAMMQFMENRNFVMSMNFHGGTEVINYPWDTFERRHPDNSWFEFISRNYADTVHTIDPSYMTNFDNGITNGYAWYVVEGGRQDFANYFLQCREVTSELSSVKFPEASALPTLWNKNYKSLLNYMEQCLYGVSGFVTDSLGAPIHAKITVLGHDADNSQVNTHEQGVYYRYLKAGIYTLLFEADGYQSVQVNNVEVIDFKRTELNVQFQLPVSIFNNKYSAISVYPNPTQHNFYINIPNGENNCFNVEVFNKLGQRVFKQNYFKQSKVSISTEYLASGMYIVRIRINEKSISEKVLVY